jgi:hypothetical protein
MILYSILLSKTKQPIIWNSEGGMRKSEERNLNSENINQLYALFAHTPYPATRNAQPVPRNLISEDRKQKTENRLRMPEIRLHGQFIPATPLILLHLPLSDILLYALCPLLYALFARNP